MSRKFWILLGIGLVSLVILAVGAAGAAFAYYRYTDSQMLSGIKEAEAGQNWRALKNKCAWYLTRHRKDVEILEKYALACSNALENRNSNTRDTVNAYFQIALQDVSKEDMITRLVDFEVAHHLWAELEYASTFFLRQREAANLGGGKSALDARLRFLQAFALDRGGRTKDAIEAYTKLVNDGCDFVDAYGGLSLLQQQQGLNEQSSEILKKAEERFPNDSHIPLFKARLLVAARSYSEADAMFAKAIEMNPNDADALAEALDAALKSKRWEQAETYAEQLVKIAPKRQEGYLGLSFLLERKNQSDKALEVLSGLPQEVRADNPELFLALAESQITRGSYDDAEKTIEAYKSSYPEHASVFDYLTGRELLAKGQAKEAADKLATVVQGAPNFVRASFYEAVALIQSKQDDRAQGVLESYLRTRPDDERARSLWQAKFGGAGSRDDVVGAAKNLVASTDASSYSLVLSARSIMRFAGMPDAQESDVRLVNQLLARAIELQPSDASGYKAQAEFLLSRKDPDGAIKAIERGEAAGADKREFVILRASVALDAGKLDEARGLLKADLDRSDIVPEDVTRWAEFFAGSNHLDIAEEALSQAGKKVNDEQRSDFDIELLSLTTRYGDTGRALETLRNITPNIARTPALSGRLNQERIELARALLRNSANVPANRDNAIELLKTVESEEPANAGARVLRANLLLKQDPPDRAGAQTLVSSVLETNPTDVDALMLMADILQNDGRPGQALDFALRAAAAAPQGSQAQLAMADAQMRVQHYREAQDALQRYIAAHPNSTRAMEMMVRAYGEQGKGAEARTMFERLEKALGDAPNKAAVLDPLRGVLAGYEGNWNEAETSLRARFNANPDDVNAAQALALTLVKMNRAEEAETLLKDFAQKNNDKADVWTLLGQFYLGRGGEDDLASASSAFTQASLITPDYSPALKGLIEVQMRGNNQGTALSLCERYLASQPDDTDMLYRKAVLLGRDKNKLDDAIAAIDRAIQISERPEFLALRASIRMSRNDFSGALKDLQHYSEIGGDMTVDINLSMAETYLALNEKDLARQYLESAKKKDEKAQKASSARIEALGKRLEEAQQKP